MQYNPLGQSDLNISEIGFGCMSLQDNKKDNIALLQQALDFGINYYDTADLYQGGANEEFVGEAFRKQRNRVIIGTKVGNEMRADGSGWDWNPSKKYIMEAVDKSLQRLKTEYIDLYQLHGGTLEDPIDDIVEAFEKLKKEGKIRHYGISSIRPNVIREWVKKGGLSSVMMQYSLLDRRPEESCLPLLKENGIGVLARGVLAKGMLAGKAADNFLNFSVEEVKALQVEMSEFTEDENHYTGAALQFALSQPAIASAVVGMRTSEQLKAIMKSYTTLPQSKAIGEALENAVQPAKYDKHR